MLAYQQQQQRRQQQEPEGHLSLSEQSEITAALLDALHQLRGRGCTGDDEMRVLISFTTDLVRASAAAAWGWRRRRCCTGGTPLT